MLLHFLFDFGLPWLSFRQAIRANDHSTIDSMYAVALDWFRAANKKLYARICVDYIYITQALNRHLKHIFNKHRTVSLLGHAGRNISFDQANEFENLDTKQMKPTNPSRINTCLTILCGLKETDAQLRSLLGVEREDPTEYTFVKPNHVEAVLKVLRDKMGGNNMNAIFGENRKKLSPFGTGVKWKDVAKMASTREKYIQHQLTSPPE